MNFTWKDGRKLAEVAIDSNTGVQLEYDLDGYLYKKTLREASEMGVYIEESYYFYSNDYVGFTYVLNQDSAIPFYEFYKESCVFGGYCLFITHVIKYLLYKCRRYPIWILV